MGEPVFSQAILISSNSSRMISSRRRFRFRSSKKRRQEHVTRDRPRCDSTRFTAAVRPYAPSHIDVTTQRMSVVQCCVWRMKVDEGAPVQLRDIPRMPEPAEDEKRDLLTDVAIPDPRNDDNPIIAQMAVLFHLLHQIVLDELKDAKKANSPADSVIDRFLCARAAVTLIYRHVIRNDLLEKTLNRDVYDFYNKSWPDIGFLEKDAASSNGDDRFPLEFSHAAFRFGHAMVRQEYQFNKDFERTGAPARTEPQFDQRAEGDAP